MNMEFKLSEIFDLQMGKTPDRKNSDYWSDATEPWISIADLSKCDKYIDKTSECISEQAVEESGIKIIPKHTVIMSFKLSIGKLAITPKEMYSNEAIMAFIDKGITKVEPTYLYYLLMNKDWNEGTNKAIMGKTLNKATLSEIKIKTHEYEKQLEIINVLDKTKSIINDRKQQIEQLDLLIKARFVEMFGDPVQNERHWKTKPLLDMGNCKNGMNFRYDDSGVEINCLGVGDFKDLSFINDTASLPTVSLNEMPTEEYLLKDEDIVFVRSNGNKALVGRSLAIYPGSVPTTFSGFCIRYRKSDKGITVPYLLRVLKTDSMRKKMAGRGANIQNLNQQILGELLIPMPPLELQNEFADFIKQVDKSKVVLVFAYKKYYNYQ